MAQVKLPLLSQDARGKYTENLGFTHKKGHSRAQKPRKPRDKKTTSQSVNRNALSAAGRLFRKKWNDYTQFFDDLDLADLNLYFQHLSLAVLNDPIPKKQRGQNFTSGDTSETNWLVSKAVKLKLHCFIRSNGQLNNTSQNDIWVTEWDAAKTNIKASTLVPGGGYFQLDTNTIAVSLSKMQIATAPDELLDPFNRFPDFDYELPIILCYPSVTSDYVAGYDFSISADNAVALERTEIKFINVTVDATLFDPEIPIIVSVRDPQILSDAGIVVIPYAQSVFGAAVHHLEFQVSCNQNAVIGDVVFLFDVQGASVKRSASVTVSVVPSAITSLELIDDTKPVCSISEQVIAVGQNTLLVSDTSAFNLSDDRLKYIAFSEPLSGGMEFEITGIDPILGEITFTPALASPLPIVGDPVYLSRLNNQILYKRNTPKPFVFKVSFERSPVPLNITAFAIGSADLQGSRFNEQTPIQTGENIVATGYEEQYFTLWVTADATGLSGFLLSVIAQDDLGLTSKTIFISFQLWQGAYLNEGLYALISPDQCILSGDEVQSIEPSEIGSQNQVYVAQGLNAAIVQGVPELGGKPAINFKQGDLDTDHVNYINGENIESPKISSFTAFCVVSGLVASSKRIDIFNNITGQSSSSMGLRVFNNFLLSMNHDSAWIGSALIKNDQPTLLWLDVIHDSTEGKDSGVMYLLILRFNASGVLEAEQISSSNFSTMTALPAPLCFAGMKDYDYHHRGYFNLGFAQLNKKAFSRSLSLATIYKLIKDFSMDDAAPYSSEPDFVLDLENKVLDLWQDGVGRTLVVEYKGNSGSIQLQLQNIQNNAIAYSGDGQTFELGSGYSIYFNIQQPGTKTLSVTNVDDFSSVTRYNLTVTLLAEFPPLHLLTGLTNFFLYCYNLNEFDFPDISGTNIRNFYTYYSQLSGLCDNKLPATLNLIRWHDMTIDHFPFGQPTTAFQVSFYNCEFNNITIDFAYLANCEFTLFFHCTGDFTVINLPDPFSGKFSIFFFNCGLTATVIRGIIDHFHSFINGSSFGNDGLNLQSNPGSAEVQNDPVYQAKIAELATYNFNVDV